MRRLIPMAMGVVLLAAQPVAHGQSTSGEYLAKDLLSPCQEADNDARWGEAAETECEQYIMGFVDALKEVGAGGSEVCPPAQNTADEVRWAYMRWVHADYATRTQMPAADALLATLKESKGITPRVAEPYLPPFDEVFVRLIQRSEGTE